jgi:cell division septation protein DedD
MNKTVEHYISELLFLHDCVILPDFGGFVGNPQSAKLNRTTGVLTPPSKQILFNTNLKTNDGLLIAHISNKEGVSQDIAKENVAKYVNELNAKLNSSQVLRINKIGLFTVGKEGNIIFTQDSSTNYSLDAFGLNTAYTKSIVRKTETEKQVEATIKTIRTTSNPKILFKAAAVIIPLVALSYLSISQQDSINSVYTQMATLNPFSSNEVAEKIVEITPEKTIEIEATPEVIATPIIKEEVAPVVIPNTKYYIIAGAFSEQKNANKMLAKLKRWNYNTEIVPGGKLIRVSYNSFTNREEALVALHKIKQENSAAWLLTK